MKAILFAASFAACFALVCASPLQDTALIPTPLHAPPNLTEVARLYMNFGSEDGNYTAYNCSAWARLWNEDGIRDTPGMPSTSGWSNLEYMCDTVRSQFTTLFCDSDLQISATSWNTERRTAFRWSINGVLASSGEQVVVPVITTLFMDPDGTIQHAWDFLDPSPIHLGAASQLTAVVNISEIIRIYMNFGGFPTYPHASNCSQWAALFGDSGIRNTPGVPPVTGYDKLLQTCNDVRGQFEVMLNYESLAIPVMSWNAQKRVAFVWDIEGMLVSGKTVHVPAITALFMDKNGIIINAWDFLDPSSIEP